MWLLWWPKNTCTTKSGGERGAASATTTSPATTGRTSSGSKNGTSSCFCTCLARIVRKVKKQSKEMGGASRQSSFQCRYDPLSYSLNFDRSGCESAVDDEDYYQFYAFSSRFVAKPSSSSRSRPPPAAAASQHTQHT